MNAGTLAGQALLLDTCVYIDRMQGRAPMKLNDLLSARLVNHSTVAIQELVHIVGLLDPSDRRTDGAVETVGVQIKSMRSHRIRTPDADVLGRAALLSGVLCRLQGYDKDNKLRALHDCVLFLQALKEGLVLLTANIGDYDPLLQMIPQGRVLFYRNV